MNAPSYFDHNAGTRSLNPGDLIDFELCIEAITLESQPARAPIVNQGAGVGGEGLSGSRSESVPDISCADRITRGG